VGLSGKYNLDGALGCFRSFLMRSISLKISDALLDVAKRLENRWSELPDPVSCRAYTALLAI
jgi:hypothetical protein